MNDHDAEIPKPLCVFCSAPWTDDMVKISAQAEIEWGYYPDDGSIQEIEVKVDIVCSSCGKLVYRKECTQRGGWWPE